MEPKTFMTEINDMISSLVNTTEAVKGASALMKNKVIGICPNCGKSVVERRKGLFLREPGMPLCTVERQRLLQASGQTDGCSCSRQVAADGRVRLKDCRSAKGKTYNATVLLTTEADGRSKFSLEFEGSC